MTQLFLDIIGCICFIFAVNPHRAAFHVRRAELFKVSLTSVALLFRLPSISRNQSRSMSASGAVQDGMRAINETDDGHASDSEVRSGNSVSLSRV